MNGSAIKDLTLNNLSLNELSLYAPQQSPAFDDFHGFLTADNITLKMLKRARKCADNNSKIIWIEGDIGTGKHLLTQSIIKQYFALKHLPTIDNIAKINQPQFNEIEKYLGKDVLLIPLIQDFSKDCLIKLQQQLINIIGSSKNTPTLIIIITYPISAYSSSAAKQISNMQQIFINNQYEYMLLQPLRNRINDIELLAKHYLLQFQRTLNIPLHLRLEQAISENIDILLRHSWEYNVKELQQYCLVMCQTLGQMLGVSTLERDLISQSLDMVSKKPHDEIAQNDLSSESKNNAVEQSFNLKRPQLCLINNHHMMQRTSMTDTNISMLKDDGSMKPFIELEYEIVSKACRHYRGSKTIAAKELGVGRTTLYRKLNRNDDLI